MSAQDTVSAIACGVPPFVDAEASFNFEPGREEQEPIVTVTFKLGDWEARDAFVAFLRRADRTGS